MPFSVSEESLTDGNGLPVHVHGVPAESRRLRPHLKGSVMSCFAQLGPSTRMRSEACSYFIKRVIIWQFATLRADAVYSRLKSFEIAFQELINESQPALEIKVGVIPPVFRCATRSQAE